MYGTTEVGVILANYPGATDFPVKPGSLGKPVPGRARGGAARRTAAPCAPDEIGEIKVWRRGDWFPTKDRGRIDADGYFYHAGRADDVIISAGWTMSAVEIEDVLLQASRGARGRGDRRARRAARPGGEGVRRQPTGRATTRSPRRCRISCAPG